MLCRWGVMVDGRGDEMFIELTGAGKPIKPRMLVSVEHIIVIFEVSETSGNAKSEMILADDEPYRVTETIEEVLELIKKASLA